MLGIANLVVEEVQLEAPAVEILNRSDLLKEIHQATGLEPFERIELDVDQIRYVYRIADRVEVLVSKRAVGKARICDYHIRSCGGERI